MKLATLILLCAMVASYSCGGGSPSVTPTPAASPPVDIAKLVAAVDQQHVRGHIDAIDTPRNTYAQRAQLTATANYVDEQLSALGYDVRRDPVTYAGATFPNVVGVQLGSVCPQRIFVVGAHYDARYNYVGPSPGADDDASGVAGMLEIARALEHTPLPVTVWFVGFTMEEDGLVGSSTMAADAQANGTQIVGMVSLEMIAYTTAESKFLYVGGNEASVRLVDATRRASAMYVPELPVVTGLATGNGETAPDIRRSDHAPFWDAGYQAMIVTDTANFRNPNYHQPTDTLDTLDLPFATNVTKAMLASMIDYVTQDTDGDGQPDACTSALAAAPTPAATAVSMLPVPAPRERAC